MSRVDLKTKLRLIKQGKSLPLIMGVINMTPDSFSRDGLLSRDISLLEYAKGLVSAGADILDIGAESTRPGSHPISSDEEHSRLFPAIEVLSEIPVPLSIDTRRPEIFREALRWGASLINDIGGLKHPEFASILKENPDIMAVIMHMQGSPETMQIKPFYEDVLTEVRAFFLERKEALESCGISSSRLIFDPGLGFGKTVAHNLSLLRHMASFSDLGPLLIAPSRKRFLDDPVHPGNPEDRDIQTGAVMAWSTLHGATIFRTHRPDIACQMRRILHMIEGERHA